MQTSKGLLVFSLFLAMSSPLAHAQDSSETPSSAGSTGGGDAAPSAPPGPPLEGLFTPPVQYPTPQSQQNLSPEIKEGEDPIKNLFNIQPQFVTPQTQVNPTPEAPKGTENHLQGFFTGQNPFKTPQTPENPQPIPKNYIPNFGKEPDSTLLQKDGDNGLESTAIGAGVNPSADSKDSKESDKDAKDKDGKDKDGKAKDKDGKDKDGKDKDAKDKDAKDKDGRLIDKDGRLIERDKDGKPIEKDKDGKPIEKSKDKDGKDATASDGKDKSDSSAEDKAKEEKAKEEKAAAEEKERKADEEAKDKALKAAGPYNPLQEAIFMLNHGQHEQAITALAKILKARPSWAEAHYVTAVAFVSMRQYKLAADEYNLVLRLVPTTPLAQMALQGLQKIGEPARPTTKYPPLHSSTR